MAGQRTFFAVFSDIGGVLGTNGLDTKLRRKTAAQFGCDEEEIDRRHALMFDSFERGHMTFEEYIQRVFFAQPRSFTPADVRDFVYSQSVPWPENIQLLREVKRLNGLKLGLISNEGEGISGYRSRSWGLREWTDFVIFSHCVRLRKPDRAIWQLGLDLAQAQAEEVIYIDDRPMFASLAGELGFTAIHHTSLAETRQALQEFGLTLPS
jgi:putative hydrolase of the HAD superfamily